MKSLSQDGGTSSSASSNGGVGKDQNGDVASAGTKVPGSGNKSGFSTGTPIVLAATGDSGSITRSGISAGSLTITDEAGQLAKTGKTAAETLASLDTTVSTDKDTTGALKPIFDKTQIEAGFTVAKELINQTGTYLDNRAKEAETKAAQAKSGIGADGKPLTDQQRQDLATEAETLKAEWGPGGTYRQITTALTVGVGGNVTGGVTGLVQGATVAYLQELGASKVKEIADSLDNETARAGLHAIVACAGAAASSQACGAAALGAAGGSVINNLLDQINNSTTLSPTEKEERAKEVGTLLAGISTLTGLNPATTANAAQIETENNRLATKSEIKRIQVLAGGDQKKEARLVAAACALIQCYEQYPAGSAERAFYLQLAKVGDSDDLKAERTLLASQSEKVTKSSSQQLVDTVPLFTYSASDGTKDFLSEYQVGTRALGVAQAAGGVAATAVGGSAIAAGGASCTVGVGCGVAALGIATTAWGIDQTTAGATTAITGDPTSTIGGKLIQQGFGVSPATAELVYGLLGGSTAADAALASSGGKVAGAAAQTAGKTQTPGELLPNPYTTVLTEKEARALIGKNEGLIYVAETPRGKQNAIDFQSGTSGAFTDLGTVKPAVPALRYDNPFPNGVNYIRFDGIETPPDGSTLLLIDSKRQLPLWIPEAQNDLKDSLTKIKSALEQNPGFKVVYEFPNLKAANAAQKFIDQTGFTSTISVRVRK
ncbi:hypothetical protein WG78_08690 [Amantichitinum ursilacus]|uniref:Toxin CdiA n=2 Tax=Amantichitinum ursilacus TaxID=857265 RepID=A0A0N0GP49_9NEIS|nr:hypothetical protein WG78_08690 [Amantichitinum ursilacus]